MPAGSPITTLAEVDRPGVTIASTGRAAYDLWLERNIRNATVIRTDTLDAALALFVADKLDVLAGLRPRLMADIDTLPGARILDGSFMSVQQAIGTPRGNAAAAQFLAAFVEEAKATGLVASFINGRGVRGLTVAPAA